MIVHVDAAALHAYMASMRITSGTGPEVGETPMDNLVQLCRFHHRLLHEGGYSVASVRGGIDFRHADARRIRPVPRPPRGSLGMLQRRHGIEGRPIDSRTCVPLWAGEGVSLRDGVDALLQLAPQEAPGV